MWATPFYKTILKKFYPIHSGYYELLNKIIFTI